MARSRLRLVAVAASLALAGCAGAQWREARRPTGAVVCPDAPTARANQATGVAVCPGDRAANAHALAVLGPAWRVAESSNVRVFSDASVRYHALVTRMLDVAVRAVQATYTQRPITRKIDVVIVDDGARVGALAQRLTAWTPGHGILGTYFPRFDVLISQRRVDGGLTTGVGTFFHEAAHALIDDASPTLPPAWFNEGFATLFEQARVVDGAFVHGNPSPGRDAVLVEALDAGRLPSLASVLVMSEADVYGDGELPYPLARSIFLYVLRQHGDAVVAAWIAAVRAGASPSDALVHVTKTSIADLDAAWRGFIDETCRPAAELARLRAQPASLADWQRLAARYPEYGAVAIEMVDVAWQARDEAAVVRAANVALRAPRLLEPERAWRGLGWALELTDRDASIAARRAAIAAQPWLEHVDVDRPAALAAQLETVGDLDGAREVRDAVAAELGLDATYVW